MKFKQLEWEDVITEIGKELGYIGLRCECFYTNYYIANSLASTPISTEGFYIEIDHELKIYKTIDDAKQAAQKDFESKIKGFFFEENSLKSEHREILDCIENYLTQPGGDQLRFTQALFNLNILSFADPEKPEMKGYVYRNNYNDSDNITLKHIEESLRKV